MKKVLSILLVSLLLQPITAQVWVPDNGNGTYKNPVIHADYSDPDAIRVGNDFYLTASSFNHAPGLPILHSKDLVNWQLVAHALSLQTPVAHFNKVQHGGGVWAPAIRYHNNEFLIYYPDPDFGIYVIKAKNIKGPWSLPKLVISGKGLIDPCPFWDDDGNCYLAHAYAGSRAGIKSILVVRAMNKQGDTANANAVMVYDGHEADPTIEGPKLYKRHGYYYIFAPAGGVSTGWQVVLRSKNIYGPYERRVVMQQGNTTINGPHQGAWVNTVNGEDWFLHFQDKDAYGRVVHLQPMQWKNGWPVIGSDADGDGIGEPVLTYKKPFTAAAITIQVPATTDEFNTASLGLQWQWQANPQETFGYTTANGFLRMFAALTDSNALLWSYPQLLTQKFSAPAFTATAKCSFYPKTVGEKFGLAVLGLDYAALAIEKKADGNYLQIISCTDAEKAKQETVQDGEKLNSTDIYLRVKVSNNAQYSFEYSTDDKQYIAIGKTYAAKPGKWIGATLGLFCSRVQKINDAGYVNIDWFRITN
jgi:beta-xylosidase